MPNDKQKVIVLYWDHGGQMYDGTRYLVCTARLYEVDHADRDGIAYVSYDAWSYINVRAQAHAKGAYNATFYGYRVTTKESAYDARELKSVLKEMIRVERRLERMVKTDGPCESFGRFLLRLARVYGCTEFYSANAPGVKYPRSNHPEKFYTDGIEHVIDHVNGVDWSWRDSFAPKGDQ